MEVFRLETPNTDVPSFIQWIFDQRKRRVGHLLEFEVMVSQGPRLRFLSHPLYDPTRPHGGSLLWDVRPVGVVFALVIDGANKSLLEITGAVADFSSLPADDRALLEPAVRALAERVEAAIRQKFRAAPSGKLHLGKGAKPGQPSNIDDDWAWSEIREKGRDEEQVFLEWSQKDAVIERPQANGLRYKFRKALQNRDGRRKKELERKK